MGQYRGVVWHKKQKAWRVRVKKMDRSVHPAREREFYKEFDSLETALRVRDYVTRMLHGPGQKLHTDGRLPPSVSRLQVIKWLVKQGAIHPKEVKKFTLSVRKLDSALP